MRTGERVRWVWAKMAEEAIMQPFSGWSFHSREVAIKAGGQSGDSLWLVSTWQESEAVPDGEEAQEKGEK